MKLTSGHISFSNPSLSAFFANKEPVMMNPVFAFWGVGPQEMMIFGIIALLLFGKRLPEVARSLGKGIVEFKKGVRGIEDDMEDNVSNRRSSQPQSRPIPEEDRAEVTAPKFEPPQFEPTVENKV
jgi:sec-independent protein translocase protein TatA